MYYEAKLSNEDHWEFIGGQCYANAAENFASAFDLGPEPESGYLIDVRFVTGRGRSSQPESFRVKSHTAVVYEATQL